MWANEPYIASSAESFLILSCYLKSSVFVNNYEIIKDVHKMCFCVSSSDLVTRISNDSIIYNLQAVYL